MKKIILALLCCMLLVAMFSCNKNNDVTLKTSNDPKIFESTDKQELENTENNTFDINNKESTKSETNAEGPENTELIQSEKHFQIYKYKDAVNKHFYRILDANGNTVISETTTRPLSISISEYGIVDIRVSFGTGVCQHQYYNIGKNILSEPFEDVFSTSGELIVYMNVPKENAMENRTLVIQNIFEKEVLFVEYQLDFSKYLIPIEKIEFLTDSKSLKITYYKGYEEELTTDILNY